MLLDGNPDLVHARELPDQAEARMFSQSGCMAFTALHRAAQMNQTAIMRLLLARGADANARAQASETALHLAVLYAYPDAVRVLLAHGAHLDCATDRGLTALHLAVLRHRADLAALLLQAGADRARADENGRTPYDWAVLKNNPAIITLFVSARPPTMGRLPPVCGEISFHARHDHPLHSVP
jgi:ankyrin repeat protein